MPITYNTGYDDAQAVNESPRSTFIYKDLNMFFTKHPTSKDVSKVTDIQAIKRAVRNLVLLNRGEKPFHPEIGGNVHGSLFENFTPIAEIELQAAIESTLSIYEPRVILEQVKVNDDSGYSLDQNKLGITISFSIANVPNVVHDVEVFLDKVR
jgi:phage baseplate assembly protein W